MVEGVEAEVVREIFRGQHQAEGHAAPSVMATLAFLVVAARLLAAQVKVEAEEHEEDEQRVFLGDAIVGDGVDAEGPERGGRERGLAVEESGAQEEERN